MLVTTRRNGNPCPCCWEYKIVQPLWKIVWRFLKKTKNWTTIWPRNSTSGYITRGEKSENTNLKRYTHTNVHSSIIYNCQDTEISVHQHMNGWRSCGIHTQWDTTQPWKDRFLQFVATWINLEDIMLSEISQTFVCMIFYEYCMNTVWYCLYVESKKFNNLLNTT